MASSVASSGKHALIIGIDYYPDPSSRLKTCVKDAEGLIEALNSAGSNRCDRFNILHAYNCKHAEFNTKLDEYIEIIKNAAIALFYFAGHAEEFEHINYLLPSDYNYDHSVKEHEYRVSKAINAQCLMHRINSAKPQICIFILDCCRTKRIRSPYGNGLSAMQAPPETLVVFSCGPGKGALDDASSNGNGIFAENLIRCIKTSTKDIETMFTHVARDVKTQTQGYQVPYRTSSLTEKVYLFGQTPQGKILLYFP